MVPLFDTFNHCSDTEILIRGVYEPNDAVLATLLRIPKFASL